MAHGAAPLQELVLLVAAELVSEVCSVYAARPGEVLELVATEGLNQKAVGRTRLRVGEGIVGLCAATVQVMNLPDAQNHPAFAYRPETGEEPFASMLAVPVRRAGRTLGVITVQNRNPRSYAEEEVDELETVAMLLADVLASAGAADGAAEGVAHTVPRVFAGRTLVPGIAIGPVVLHGYQRHAVRLLADDTEAELVRLHEATQRMQQDVDDLIAGVPDGLVLVDLPQPLLGDARGLALVGEQVAVGVGDRLLPGGVSVEVVNCLVAIWVLFQPGTVVAEVAFEELPKRPPEAV